MAVGRRDFNSAGRNGARGLIKMIVGAVVDVEGRPWTSESVTEVSMRERWSRRS